MTPAAVVFAVLACITIAAIADTKEAKMAAVPIQPAIRPGHTRHPRAITMVPASGNAITSQP